jgi:deazaflavin-dependent oxidoreductase (nitroreductase family)
MAYRKPPAFAAKVFNPIALRFGISGTQTLSLTGRRTGATHRVPVIPIEHDGKRYLVSPRGEAHWVRNLRAAGGDGELSTKGRTERFHATEVSMDQRPPILAAYQAKAGKAVASHFKALPDPKDHPVFRLDPR